MNGPALERLLVLVVDGNRHMRTLVKGILRAFGIRGVRECDNAAAALKELRIGAIDLIITEYALEPITGVEFVKMVRSAKDIPNHFIPIIMLTGYTEIQAVMAARDSGINEFLAKPISAEALYARLCAAIYDPRPFVQCKTYLGPDRRRSHVAVKYRGDERRRAAPLAAAVID